MTAAIQNIGALFFGQRGEMPQTEYDSNRLRRAVVWAAVILGIVQVVCGTVIYAVWKKDGLDAFGRIVGTTSILMMTLIGWIALMREQQKTRHDLRGAANHATLAATVAAKESEQAKDAAAAARETAAETRAVINETKETVEKVAADGVMPRGELEAVIDRVARRACREEHEAIVAGHSCPFPDCPSNRGKR